MLNKLQNITLHYVGHDLQNIFHYVHDRAMTLKAYVLTLHGNLVGLFFLSQR